MHVNRARLTSRLTDQDQGLSGSNFICCSYIWFLLYNHIFGACVHSLSPEGTVTTWGANDHGQLGLGSVGGVRDIPEMLTCLNGIPVAQVVAGGNHSFTLSMSGAIHGWGKNR